MAIDFPNSPSVNDLYTAGGKTWQWNGTYWAAYGTGPVLRTSDTAPVSPNTGDMWYETDTGRLFTYIDSTWVEIGNATDIAGAIQPGQITALSAVTSLTTDDVFPVVDNPSSATAANKITYGNLVTALSASLAPGLVLVKTQTVGTGVASVTVTDAFSSTYDNYHITWTGGTVSALALVEVYMGNAPTSSVYQGARVSSSTAGVMNSVGDANQSSWVFAGVGSTTFAIMSFDLYNPFASRRTGIYSKYFEFGASNAFGTYVGILNNDTSYTSFTLDGNGGVTLTGGTIRVYGYRNS